MCYKTRCQYTEDCCGSFLMAGNVRRMNRRHIGWNLKLLLNLHHTMLNFKVILDTYYQCEKHEESSY